MPQTLRPVLTFGLVIWVVEIIDWLLFDGGLDRQGIRPRELSGLLGIPCAPFLHGGFGHLVSNTVPLLLLGALVARKGISEWVESTVVVTLLGGGIVWLFGGSNTVHIGASILVFGYAGDLLARGFVRRAPLDLVIALIVGVLYGGALLRGLIPAEQVSTLGHLGGLIAGSLVGGLAAKGKR